MTKLLLIIGFLSFLSGCTAALDAAVKEPISPDPGRRSLGTYLDDEQLESIITVNIRKTSPELAQSNIHVHSFNGIVLLTGEAPSDDVRQQATQAAQGLQGVKMLHNEMHIQSNATFYSRANDRWLATKLRSTLLAARDIESTRVKIVVENGVIFLMGLLTRTEADRASELAAGIEGAEKVVRVIEYIER